MTVKEVVDGLQIKETQRIIVKSLSREFGYIPLAGGFREKVLKYTAEREVVGCEILNNCLHLKVRFQEEDLV